MPLSLRRASLLCLCFLWISCSKAPPKKIWEDFSGEKALAHVQSLVDLGPRPAGSDALVRARAYIEEQLESCGWKVTEEAFVDPIPRGGVKFVNLVARFGRGAKSNAVFLLCSHYDTKIFDAFRFVDVTDDHTPLNAIGVPVIDLIDFRFDYWHTADDTIDKLSAQSLQTVGLVALYYLSLFAFK